jgi:hypothetical protein
MHVNLAHLASLATANVAFPFPPVVSVLVDMWGCPYNEGERLEHNKRVREGAPYAELLTVEEMSKRYRLLSKPKRVFDLVKGHSWSPSEFHGIYGASGVKVGRKRVYVSQLCLQELASASPNMGVFFHSLNEQGEIEWQGQVLADQRKDKHSVYTVQLFNWVLGDEGGESFEVDARSTKGWRWYGSAEEMRAAYEQYESQRIGDVVLAE